MENFIDEEIRHSMWNSKIPIKIDMAIEDVNDVELPNSLYVIIYNKNINTKDKELLFTIN